MSMFPGWAPACTRCPYMPSRPPTWGSRASIPNRFRSESPVAATERLFGTDGVRGTPGRYPLDRATVPRLGAALVRALRRESGLGTRDSNPESRITNPAQFLVRRDTRESGDWIEAELAH